MTDTDAMLKVLSSVAKPPEDPQQILELLKPLKPRALIVVDKLPQECAEHAQLVANIAEAVAMISTIQQQTQSDLAALKAELDGRIRVREKDRPTTRRLTETAIKAEIARSNQVQTLEKTLQEISRALKYLDDYRDVYRHRKDMLITLGSVAGDEFRSVIRMKRGEDNV